MGNAYFHVAIVSMFGTTNLAMKVSTCFDQEYKIRYATGRGTTQQQHTSGYPSWCGSHTEKEIKLTVLRQHQENSDNWFMSISCADLRRRGSKLLIPDFSAVYS